MSALPPKADIGGRQLDVRFVPEADIATISKTSSGNGSSYIEDATAASFENSFGE
jgi:hypothetical protein